MRRLYIGVLALLRTDAATIDANRRTSNVAVFGTAAVCCAASSQWPEVRRLEWVRGGDDGRRDDER